MSSEAENGGYVKINKKLIPAKGSAIKRARYNFVGGKKGNCDEYYHFSFLVSAFWIALIIAKVQTLNCLAISAESIPSLRFK